ncbi:cation/H(+) antiporter 14-like isoform X1 [Prunus avium]|uniref:Cation/H(+) antiporter 14-like isoform X1 n=2 Tax=Prunus avium TaxID=42229 RepID=A0A6P5SAN9_PRUAV|nr:cation/H(+) antiporter 14-like isoform X1 [Prunus avium]
MNTRYPFYTTRMIQIALPAIVLVLLLCCICLDCSDVMIYFNQAGIIIGPTILGRYVTFMRYLFPPEGRVTLQIFANLGFMFHFFILGVQLNANLLKKVGTNAALIGSLAFAMPYVIGGLTYLTMRSLMPMDQTLRTGLVVVVTANSLSSFPVIISLLSELNILNSELGRLAIYTSMVSDLCCVCMATTLTTVGAFREHSKWNSLSSMFWMVFFVFVILFVLRPFILWLTQKTPEGQQLEEFHFFVILVLVFGCAFCSQYLGRQPAFGPLLLGIVLPEGPPIATTVVKKLDTITNGLFIPVFFAISGLTTDLMAFRGRRALAITELVIIMGYVGKFLGTLLPALYFGVPFRDATSLALIMCCKGIIDVAIYNAWRDGKIMDDLCFGLLLITMLIVTGIARIMVGRLYDPSRRYTAYGRRTILNSSNNSRLRILVCIQNEEHVPGLINLLEASNPTRFNPITVFVLHLSELTGHAVASLVPHHHLKKVTSQATSSKHIVNAFNRYEQRQQGSALVQHFNAIAPYSSMHDDVCSLALDKSITIVILPYHKQWTIFGSVGATNRSIKYVNGKIMNKAPCSVSFLIDRGQLGGNPSVVIGKTFYRIALLFFGGVDDLEALAYGRRMAEHPNISFTLVRFKHEKVHTEKGEINPEHELIREYTISAAMSKGKNQYREETVKDGSETTQIIRSMEDGFDLVIVGCHHDPESPLLLGLMNADWVECPELGVIGDILAATDFTFSVLVVQQQPPTSTCSRSVQSLVFPASFDDGGDCPPPHSTNPISSDESKRCPV